MGLVTQGKNVAVKRRGVYCSGMKKKILEQAKDGGKIVCHKRNQNFGHKKENT